MNTTRWVLPEAAEPAAVAARAGSQAGSVAAGRPLRLGLLDNTKDNARLLLELVGEQVRREFDTQLLYRRKGNATVGAAPELLDELAREADVVLTAA